MQEPTEQVLQDAIVMLASGEYLDAACSTDKSATAKLPPELLEVVFNLIEHRDDMCHVSLVCRNWRTVMARPMWATLATDFRPSGSQDLDALLAPKSGILPHVRRLVVEKARDWLDTDGYLSTVLENMPRDSLKELITFDGMSSMVLKDVIVWQSKLERLYGYIRPDFTDFQENDWVLSYNFGIRIYTMILKDDTLAASLKMHQFLLRGMPRLEQFHVCYDAYRSPHVLQEAFVDISPMLTKELCFSQLRFILLCHVDMEHSSQLLFDCIDISRLHALRLLDCVEVEPFLDQLSRWYKKNPGGLEKFHFSFTKKWWMADRDYSKDAVERFLTCCPSLSLIRLDFWETPLLKTECIARHGATLRKLHLSVYSWPVEPEMSAPVYSVQDLETILRACQCLIKFSVDVPWGSVDLSPIEQSSCSYELTRCEVKRPLVFEEFESILAVIAKHPNIHTLRFLNLPRIEYSSWIEVNRHMMPLSHDDARRCQGLIEKFANEVFRFLSSHGSSVQILDILPVLQPPTPNESDGNGHQWPNYSYKAHKTTYQGCTVRWAKPCDTVYWARSLE